MGGAYDGVKSTFYFVSYMFGFAGEFAQPGWGRQTSGTSNAPSKGYQYGQYTKTTPQGNDVTIYNGRGQAVLRYDYSHPHAGMQPHVHQFDWWKYNGKWRWNGKTGNVYPL